MLTAVAAINKRKPHYRAAESALPGCSCTIPKRLRASAGLPLFMQAKLSISQPGDPCEQEADAVAERVMRMEVRDKTRLETSRLNRPVVSRSTDGAAVAGEAPTSVHAALASPGQPLARPNALFLSRGSAWISARCRCTRMVSRSSLRMMPTPTLTPSVPIWCSVLAVTHPMPPVAKNSWRMSSLMWCSRSEAVRQQCNDNVRKTLP
jgi:hypothetical protein